jgi:gliding motility-associated-like protein
VNADISGTGIDSTQWNMGDGTIFADSTSISYSYTTEGIYPIEVIAWDLTCNVSDTLYDTLNFITTFSIATANAPADTTLCSNPPFDIPFTSDGSTPYVSWDFGDGNTSTAQNPTNTFATTGTYTVLFVAIDSSTCNIADTVPFTVEIIQAPTFSASFNLPVIPPCSDPTSVMVNVDISGTGIDSTHWDMGDGTTFEDSTSISYNYTSTGIYDIVITAWDYCGGDTSIFETFNFITDSSLAVASAPEDTTLCTLPPFSISFTSSGTSGTQFWDFGDGNTSTDVNPTNTFLDSGTYVVTYIAIDSSTCNIADTAYFNVNLIQAEQFSAEINFTPPPPCGGDSMLVELDFSGTAADSLIWDMGNGDVFYADSVAYYYTEAGIYNLSLTAFDFTCNLMEVISSEVPFFGNISTDVIIPNVFTPNGDGENDLLTFVNVSGSETYRLTIWNRWGRKVFITDDPIDHWDGVSMKDKTIHEGVYYFEILFTDVCSDEEQIKTGFVHLMR